MEAFSYAGNQHQYSSGTVTLTSRSLGSPEEATPMARPFEPAKLKRVIRVLAGEAPERFSLPAKTKPIRLGLLNSEEV
jgi:hypothetical protein